MKHLWAPWRMVYLQGERKTVDGCLFCHKISAHNDEEELVLYRGKRCFVVLNRYPYNTGHMMVVPYQHTGAFESLDDETLLEMSHLVQQCVRFLQEVYHPQGFNIGINQGAAAGAGVAEHLHVHIVPRWGGDASYITVIGETRVVPQTLEETYVIFRPMFDAWERE